MLKTGFFTLRMKLNTGDALSIGVQQRALSCSECVRMRESAAEGLQASLCGYKQCVFLQIYL